jgi:hypothetical protein
MPQVSAIIKDSEIDPVTYVHQQGSNARIQLVAQYDIKDMRGQVIERGRTLKADFDKGLFMTNDPEIISLLEKSLAYESGKIERADVLQARANDKLVDELIRIATENDDVAAKLRSKMTKMQMAKAKASEGDQEPNQE